MGISLPGLIAGHIVDHDRPVVSIMGDGGALMNIQELETAVRLGVKGVILVLNDNNYGLIEWKQNMNEGKSYGTKLGNPNFVDLSNSFGIEAYQPKNIGDLKVKVSEAIDQDKLVLLEIPIETAVNNELIQTLEDYYKNK